MPDSGLNPRDHFNRQRRNLIIASIILFFYEFVDLTTTEINFFGSKADVGNAERIYIFILLSVPYFLWRYKTALAELKNKTDPYTKYTIEKSISVLEKISKPKRKRRNFHRKIYRDDQISLLNPTYIHYSEKAFQVQIRDANSFLNQRKKYRKHTGLHFYYLIKGLYVQTFNSSYFSEYILPYLIGFSLLIYTIYEIKA